MSEIAPVSQIVALLLAAIACVVLATRLGLGPVVGYLVAGVVVGPHGLGLLNENHLVQLLAEFGVVFLLFAVGLELPLARLRAIGGRSLVLGLAQILLGVLAIGGVARLAGLDPGAALVVGFGLTLSSTAVVIRLLTDRGELATRFGRTVFAVLMLQDLAVGPMLVAVAALGGRGDPTVYLPVLLAGLLFVAVAIWLGPRLLERLYAAVARSGPEELLVACSLLVAIAFASGTALAGLSLALGGFLAGMLLADTAFRHQVAADIRPFRGLLVGLFFVTVGMGTQLDLGPSSWALVLATTAALLVGKTALVAVLALALGFGLRQALRLGLLLAQAGEFAFVLWAAAARQGVLSAEAGGVLAPAVVLGMVLTPLLARLGASLAAPSAEAVLPRADLVDAPPTPETGHVIIAGAGRVGLQVAEALREAGVGIVGIDISPDRIRQARLRGLPFYYGDVTRPEVLDNVHVERASALVLAIDDRARMRQAVALVRYLFPELPLLVRVLDEAEVETYRRLDATVVVPEVIETGRHLAAATLRLLAGREEAEPASN